MGKTILLLNLNFNLIVTPIMNITIIIKNKTTTTIDIVKNIL